MSDAVSPEGFLPRCENSPLAAPAQPAGIPVGQGPVQEKRSQSTNGHGPGVGRGCLNTVNSKGMEGCDGFGCVCVLLGTVPG